MEALAPQEVGVPEIAFFDVETTVPSRSTPGYALLEFGAILVCPRTLVEVASYSTLICPSDPASISATSVRCNGITREAVAAAPSFREVADRVFAVLHGRLWAGHNIVRFDCARIREAFAEIGRPAPEPKGTIDTLPLLTQKFGRRAGNMKMATLATYFGLGQQKHRSLDDVRMNLEVLKYCATVLFLESSLPDAFSVNSLVYENTIMRSQVNGNASPCGADVNMNSSSVLLSNQRMDRKHILEVNDLAESSTWESNRDSSSLLAQIEQINIDPPQTAVSADGSSALHSPEIFCTTIASSEGPSGHAGFLEPDDISLDSIRASEPSSHHCGRRIQLLHGHTPLQLCCLGLKIRFGVNAKFTDHAGRPKLNIVVDALEPLCQVLNICDRLAQRSSMDSGSSSEWRPVIMTTGYSNSSSIRLHIPTVSNGDTATCPTEMCRKEPSGKMQELILSKLDAVVLEQLLVAGTIIDAYFSFDIYDYQHYAGIRLVAKRLVLASI